jgi:hypothetical protein
MQAGHRFASTTALYTGVSGDCKNEAMSRAERAAHRGARRGRDWLMSKIDYEWMLRPLLAEHGVTAMQNSRHCSPSTRGR